jgi:hypothetical protein
MRLLAALVLTAVINAATVLGQCTFASSVFPHAQEIASIMRSKGITDNNALPSFWQTCSRSLL